MQTNLSFSPFVQNSRFFPEVSNQLYLCVLQKPGICILTFAPFCTSARKKATFWTPLHSRCVLLSIRTSKQYRHQRPREHLQFYFKYVHAQYTKSFSEGIPPETVMLSNESCFETPVKDPPPIAVGILNLRTGESKAEEKRLSHDTVLRFAAEKKRPSSSLRRVLTSALSHFSAQTHKRQSLRHGRHTFHPGELN